ncbi:MAG: hypothetical protein WA364_11705 [Candidatus Nitrosopolaris sp.]
MVKSHGPEYIPELFQSFILIVLAFLASAIAIRHKKRSNSKIASDILTDITRVRNELSDNNHRNDPFGFMLGIQTLTMNDKLFAITEIIKKSTIFIQP